MRHAPEPLSRRAFRVYKALEFFNRMGQCFPEQDRIRRYLKIKALSTVERGVRELKEKGWITVKRRSQNSLIYTLLGNPSRDGSLRRSKSPLIMKMELKLTGQKTVIDGSGDGSGDGSYLYSLKQTPQPLLETNVAQRSEPTREPRRRLPMQMPDYYRTADERKLWRMAARWISENNPDLSGSPDRCAPIMYALEKAGVLALPEDGPLPAIAWAPEANPLLKLAEAVERKPVRSLTEADYEFLKRKIGQ